MRRLGHTRHVAQGGDWGSPVSSAMARQAPAGLLGIHTNLPATVPAEIAKALSDGRPAPAGLTEQERAAFDELNMSAKEGNRPYALMMGTRPQTIGYGLMDFPAGHVTTTEERTVVVVRPHVSRIGERRANPTGVRGAWCWRRELPLL